MFVSLDFATDELSLSISDGTSKHSRSFHLFCVAVAERDFVCYTLFQMNVETYKRDYLISYEYKSCLDFELACATRIVIRKTQSLQFNSHHYFSCLLLIFHHISFGDLFRILVTQTVWVKNLASKNLIQMTVIILAVGNLMAHCQP